MRDARSRAKADDFPAALESTEKVLALEPSHAEARQLKGEMEEEIADLARKRESAVRDLLDELVDAIEGQDLEDLLELWGDSPPAATRSHFEALFSRFKKLEVETRELSVSGRGLKATFTVVVAIRGRVKRGALFEEVESRRWRGAAVKQGFSERFTAPYP